MDQLTKTNMPVLDNFWMPFTANRQFKAAPRLLATAKGMYYTDIDGNKVLDGTAGLWCCNAGHSRERIARAVERQLSTLDFAPTFQMGHPIAFDFAAKLAANSPGGAAAKLDRIFFTGSGSEAVDTALKIAIAYQRAIGQGTRSRIIGREKGYHGVGFGGLSVGGLVNNRRAFPQIPADHLRHTLDLERNAFSRGLPEHGVELADDFERLVSLHGAETIAAVIIEPMAGAGGVILPPKGYLERIRTIADKYGIVLIFDEVISGFGRLGAPFATDFFGVTPDLVTAAKGITNGAVPMGAVFASRTIHDALMTGPENAIELFHGYTYSGHPVACAAGLATLEIYEEESLLTRAADLAKHWEDALHSLKGLPNVIDIRNLGLVGAIELMPREGAPGTRTYDVFLDCLRRGLLTRASGDVIALSPPLIIEHKQIEEIVSIIADALSAVR
ncbi:aspartate aminotransferase family protein [Rhizobium phaseoli]|uniref:aspartate aminotransferase family protein n=1 Tax=Rhizobium phaseoli TaxID=396 RepID=UPI000BE7FA22|nr:aspartate aminotransferase family protein [Rhizobium phaseoli]PDS28342.1 aspartate aminotransferase family protein [Rhizobium phaseoli]